MNAYRHFFRLNLFTGMQYRVAAYAGIVTQFFWGFMYIMIYKAFYGATGNSEFDLGALVSYIWLQQAFLALIMSWFRDGELFELITSGNLAYELCRPLDLYRLWYSKLLAKRLSAAALRFWPILIFALMLPAPYRLSMPHDPLALLLFLVAMSLGALLMVSLSMFVYIGTMVTMSSLGTLLIYAMIADFFAGVIIPIPLMPDAVRKIVEWMPFRFTADFPFRIYSGHIGHSEAFIGILLQLAWILITIWIGSAWMKSRIKHVVVQGG